MRVGHVLYLGLYSLKSVYICTFGTFYVGLQNAGRNGPFFESLLHYQVEYSLSNVY